MTILSLRGGGGGGGGGGGTERKTVSNFSIISAFIV